MICTNILLELIENGINIEYENERHKDIIYNVLVELGVDENIRNNQAVFKEIFASFTKITGNNEYSSYNKKTFTFLNNSQDGNYRKTLLVNNGDLIIITNKVDKIDVINETLTYKIEGENIKKTKEFERFDYVLAQHNSVLFTFISSNEVINDCGFYILKEINKLEKNTHDLNKSFVKLERSALSPCIVVSNEKEINGYLPDLGDFDMSESINGALKTNEEDALIDIISKIHAIEENIEKSTQEDYNGTIKEYYKKRYEDYKSLINNYTYKKV